MPIAGGGTPNRGTKEAAEHADHRRQALRQARHRGDRAEDHRGADERTRRVVRRFARAHPGDRAGREPEALGDRRPGAGLIPAAELEARRGRLLDHVVREGLAGYVLFDAAYIRYFTNFNFLATERPVVFAQNAAEEMVVLVPEFEVERVRAETDFERIESYPEYPGLEHPLRILGRVLAELGVTGKIGADQDGYPGILGYEGPPLSEVTASTVAPLGAVIESMLARKSETEIALIRESARWCAHAHRLLQEYTRPGATEAEASLRAGHEATVAMLAALGDNGQQASADGRSAGYRRPIGLRRTWTHAVAHNSEFKTGDLLGTDTWAPVCGSKRRV